MQGNVAQCIGQSHLILTRTRKQTSGDPSGVTWYYHGITTALLYGVVSHNGQNCGNAVEYLLKSKD